MLASIFGCKMKNNFISKHPTLFTIWAVASFAALIMAIYSVNDSHIVLKPILRGVVCLLASTSAILTIFMLEKRPSRFCIALLCAFPVLLICGWLFFPTREDYLCYNVYFVITVIYFAHGLLANWLKKDKEAFANGLLPLMYSCMLILAKVFELDRYVTTFDDEITKILLKISLGAGAISIVLYLIFAKKGDSKKSYTSNLFVTAVLVFALVFAFPYFVTNSLNYALDSSEGVEVKYQVVDKGYSHGRHKSPGSYYVVILHNGEEVKVKLTANEYDYYKVGGYITLTEHEGALGLTYLEYDAGY